MARESLFLAALDLHRSFIETHPGQILSNLTLVSDWLQGKNIPEKQAALALDSLSLIIPVISTTFASIPRMFKMIGREAIGWLLIDEAGQALPQQAAGAIWRAERTVVVGELRDVHNVLSENIFLISPFRDCARKLWRLAANLGFDTQKTGTVHTTQGKEASIVVFVLGGNVQNPGARAWAASRPNLLNVAVSRAKQRLYVIGCRSGWQKHRYFSTQAKNLPVSSLSNTSVQNTEDVLS
ncbi:AAA domain-containing protein [Pseudescherichia vulneris]